MLRTWLRAWQFILTVDALYHEKGRILCGFLGRLWARVRVFKVHAGVRAMSAYGY